MLGMNSGLEILVESERGLPLELRGRIPVLGKLRVRLAAATMREAEAALRSGRLTVGAVYAYVWIEPI